MKTKTKILTACVIALTVIAGCKKTVNPADMPEQQVTEVEQTGFQKIRQQTYDLTLEQTNAVVSNFKDGLKAQNNNAQAKLIEADSVALDSSIFVLEAALNFDFDLENDDNYERSTILSQFSIPIDEYAQKVLSDDLENVYTELTNFLIANTTAQIKVQIVDIEGFITSANKVTYQAEVVTFNKGVPNPCGSINSSASPHLTEFQYFNCSNGNPSLDATTVIKQKINCPDPNEVFCTFGTYYTNVVSYNTKSTNSKSSWKGLINTTANYLFYSGANNASGHCSAYYHTLTSSQLTTYLTASKTELSANVPTTPTNMRIASAGHKPKSDLIVGPSSYYVITWDMYATYGVKHCRNVVKEPPYNSDPN